ncbi:hypothetical protein PGTUg99_006947 [Puccinia graminis f. sp. tritici]|uniref:Uncharacterized protein n=1 Tax=Puccinia graminis f. sp. tritici TaxID=56615 RepID=A0A5B0S3D3_PUCGR|nr:hypothetical protein PGTUg99_006947 [Puccinia graminis f. sp. tritici]
MVFPIFQSLSDQLGLTLHSVLDTPASISGGPRSKLRYFRFNAEQAITITGGGDFLELGRSTISIALARITCNHGSRS